MAKFSSKHKDRIQDFFVKTFADGLNMDVSPSFLPTTALTRCKNMRYFQSKAVDGTPVVMVRKRQGTQVITTTAHSAPILACTYYISDPAGSKYIVATATTIHELNDGATTFAPSTSLGTIEGRPTFTEFKGKLIIHDSGHTKAWNGTTFETLGGLHEDEIIGTGDNFGTTAFSGTLQSPPITAGSLIITFTDSTGRTMTDNGAGAFTGYGTGTINYTTGAWTIAATGAPDNLTSIYAEYETVAGAPKSKAGFVRASRLYMWGDEDYPSRLWYSAPNDEDSWKGYIDVDPLDGYSIIGCLNFFQFIVVIKGNSLKRINDFPGDTTFRVEPLMENTGSIAYQTCLNDGNMVSFLSKEGWIGLTATQAYGDVSKSADLSAKFRANAIAYTTVDCYADYNQLDKQLWLTLYNGLVQLPTVYVINIETGGQLSLYEFAFDHTCYKFVNGEMLIGGKDGNLYKLYANSERYKDNAVSYASITYIRGVMTNWGIGLNRKHNKKIYIHCYGQAGMTATLNIYTNGNYATPVYTKSISTTGEGVLIYDLQDIDIFDMSDPINEEIVAGTEPSIDKKFNYNDVMFEITNIEGARGAEFYGVDFSGAVLGP